MDAKPRIGITCDYEAEGERCTIRHPYTQAVVQAGGIPIIVPQVPLGLFDDYLDLLDGVIFTGGRSDYHPRHYGQELHEAVVPLPPLREDFDLAFFAAVRRRRLPILGICGGMQLAAIHFGAHLIQDLPSLRAGPIDHRVLDFSQIIHGIETVPGSRCAQFLGETCTVNSVHHQALDESRLPAGLAVAARSSDGVVEAIEVAPGGPLDDGSWFVGVQWHPEWLHAAQPHGRLFAELVAACRAGQAVPETPT